MNTGQKDATLDDSTGDLLGVYNGGRNKLPVLHDFPGDDEVIHLVRLRAISRCENAVELAGAIAIHSVSSRLGSGCDRPCASCRSSSGLVNDGAPRQIA